MSDRYSNSRDLPLEHWHSDEPFDPQSIEQLSPEQEKYYLASQWKMMWWKFCRHRLAVFSGLVLLAFYLSIVFTEFLAPYELHSRNTKFIFAPPQSIHIFHEGELRAPFVYGYRQRLNLDTLQREYRIDENRIYTLRYFCRGDEYNMWGLFKADLHLVCPDDQRRASFFWLGTDRLGRDILSRIIYGTRISLTIGLIGIIISFTLGIILGGISGYYGGWIDNIIQRTIELLKSLPQLPLWLALSAALPVTWSPIWVFFGLTIILGLLDWPGLARAVRSKFLSLREEDFTTSAQLMGASPSRIIGRHLLPSFASHLIASASLAVPSMILGETALSFLGLGLRPPITSWGVLLNETTNINAVATTPWLMYPVVPVIIVVLAFNFLGDGLRDAADPYK